MNETEILLDCLKKRIVENDLSATEKCVVASEKDPTNWPEVVLYPNYPSGLSIFGFSHVAMDMTKSISLIEALTWTGLCDSNGVARKAIKGNGIMVNRKRIVDAGYILSEKDALLNLDAIVLEFGKYNIGIIEFC